MTNNLFDSSQAGQIKLREISMFNWGSFAGLHTAHIDPNGTLITGDNGAGKSTLVDALMALLMPPRQANFNIAAAQNDKSDRTILSYMRGSYGQTHDGATTATKSKRNKKVITGLRALYHQGDNDDKKKDKNKGNDITLIGLFWADSNATSVSDVRRIYLVANHDVTLPDVLAEFNENYDRHFRSWLDNQNISHTQTFDAYQTLYQQVLCLGNKNAPALLSRALGLKKIDNLTDLIRTLVLEPSNLKDDAQGIVKEFDTLKKEHDILLDAREQAKKLEPLTNLAKKLEQLKSDIAQLETLGKAVPIYHAKHEQRQLEQDLAVLQSDYHTIKNNIDENQTQLQQMQESSQKYYTEYMNLGGNRIEELQKEIGYTQRELARISKNASAYQSLCEKLTIAKDLQQTIFEHHQQQAVNEQQNLEHQLTEAQSDFGVVSGQFSLIQQEFTHIQAEVQEIKARPNSNIPLQLQQWRDTLCHDLNLSLDNTKFIGEMLDIKGDQTTWQGAIERALGGLRTTLLLDKAVYSSVTSYINSQRHTGLYLRVQVVDSDNRQSAEFLPNGFLRKLAWREHPYREWLKGFLKKHDLTCVESTQVLDNTPFSMTINGLIHKEKGRFEKKDISKIDDKRQWQLGFNNQVLLNSLLEQQADLRNQLLGQEKRLNQSRQTMENIRKLKENWQKIQDFTWREIDVPSWQQQLEQQQQQLAIIENAQGDIAKFKQLYQESKDSIVTLTQQSQTLNRQEGKIQEKLNHIETKISQNAHLANQAISEDTLAQLDKHSQNLADKFQLASTIQASLDSKTKRLSEETNTAGRIMAGFKANPKWQPISADWTDNEQGMADFIGYYDKLVKEGLGKLTEKFESRMNNNLTQSLVNFRTKMNTEKEQIKQGIEQVNQVLQKTEFRPNTFLRLKIKSENYAHVVDFNKQLTNLMGLMTTEEHEKRFKLLSDINVILDKASSGTTANNVESLRLLDPRYQMSFNAEEFKTDLDTGEEQVIDVLSSSSGKSGGEKESFAGIIVAASLAYVLTPTGGDKPIYSTVFLDEAFSNTQESVSRRVLNVFNKLNIHINLITPYKNLNLAREAANSLIICERNINEHESQMTEVTWEEYDQQKNQTNHLKNQLENMNIQIQSMTT